MLDHVLKLIAAGAYVFPILPPSGEESDSNKRASGKYPAIRDWYHTATRSPDVARAWWGQHPDHNVGIHLRGLVALDVDGQEGHKHFLSLVKAGLIQPFDEPGDITTLVSLSGNAKPNHYQYIYRLPDGTRIKNKPLRSFKGYESCAKIDLKSTRGMVVGAGSLHKSGGRYRWLNLPANIYTDAAPAPAWLLALAQEDDTDQARYDESGKTWFQTRPTSRSRPMADDPWDDETFVHVITERWPIGGEGVRNQAMTAAAAYLRSRRLGETRILELMTKWLRAFEGNYRTDWNTCLAELHSLLARDKNKLAAGTFYLPPDHDRLTAEQELHPLLAEFLVNLFPTTFLHSSSVINTFSHSPAPDSEKTRTRAPTGWCPGSAPGSGPAAGCPLARTHEPARPPMRARGAVEEGADNEQPVSRDSVGEQLLGAREEREIGFLHSLLLHYQYDRQVKGNVGDELLLTDRQLLVIYHRLVGKQLSKDGLMAMKAKYITRHAADGTLCKARKRELLVMHKPGKIGTASVYKVMGLPALTTPCSVDTIVQDNPPYWLEEYEPEGSLTGYWYWYEEAWWETAYD